MDMKQEYLGKLREEQEKSYMKCLGIIAKWIKFRDDYLELKKRLDTLADKTEYDVMVPFNSVAFMPGKLVHTNEIMVLLGDNWFVERSAKQASEIVQRRLAKCDSTLEQLNKECKQLETWKEHTTDVQKEIDEYVEIKEECSEAEYKLWREKHRENVRRHIEARKKNGSQDVGTSDIDTGLSHELWVLPEAHEDIDSINEGNISSEETDEETELSSSSNSSNENESSDVSINKRVHWKDDLETCTTDRKEELNLTVPSGTKASSNVPIIQSPADIYKQFVGLSQSILIPPKSILKPTESNGSVIVPQTLETDIDTAASKLNEQHMKAFSGIVLERRLPNEGSASLVDIPSSKKISKFKAQRLVQRT